MQQSPVSRGNAVEDAPKDEAAARRDQDASLLIVGRSSIGQLLECGALDLDALAVRGVARATTSSMRWRQGPRTRVSRAAAARRAARA